MSLNDSTRFDSKAAIVSEELKELSFRTKIIRTCVMALAWLCMGLYSEISGPTLPYLIKRINGDYEVISRALVARNVGFLSASFYGGILCERFRRYVDIWMAFSLAMAAVATAVVPWCRSLTLLAAMLFVDGMGKGILAAGGSAFVIRMWLGAAAVPVHAIHLAFDVGALIAPQIVRPFLGEWTEERTDDPASRDLTNSTHVLENVHDRLTQFASTDIEYPYAIIACLTLAGAAMFVVLFSFAASIPQGARLSPSTLSEVVSPTAWCDADDPTVAVQMVPTLFFAFLLPSGTERAYARFVFALAVTGRTHMAPADAAVLETVFWASFAVGLISATACAHWVAPLKLLLCQVAMYCVAATALAAGGVTQPCVLWAGTAILGMSLAPLFPTLLSWTNEHVEVFKVTVNPAGTETLFRCRLRSRNNAEITVTATLTSVAFAACACGSILGSWFAGYLFQYYGPAALLHFILVAALLTAAVLARLFVLARRCHVDLVHESTF